MFPKNKKLNIFTWNIHGGYHNMLVKTGHNFYLPVKKGRPYNYDGKTPGYKWPRNTIEISVADIKKIKFDLLIFHTTQQLFEEQYKVLNAEQRKLPKIYIFHTPIIKNPKADQKRRKMTHKFIDEGLPQLSAIVHITRYNFRQWIKFIPQMKNKSTIIYPGLAVNKIKQPIGSKPKAIMVVNDLANRSECGPDIYKKVAKLIPITLYGSNSEKLDGLGTCLNTLLNKEFSDHRVYFNCTLASSVPTAMLEAMSVGLPVVSTATTELPGIIKNGYNGFISNDINFLVEKLNLLIKDKKLAQKLGYNSRRVIQKQFSLKTFLKKWNTVFTMVLK